MTHVTAEARLIALATEIGLRKSVNLLQEHLLQNIVRIITQSPLENIEATIRTALGVAGVFPVEAVETPALPIVASPTVAASISDNYVLGLRRKYLPKAPKKTPYPGTSEQTEQTARFEQDGEYTLLHLSDGRTWRSKRSRDLALRARKAGFSIEKT